MVIKTPAAPYSDVLSRFLCLHADKRLLKDGKSQDFSSHRRQKHALIIRI